MGDLNKPTLIIPVFKRLEHTKRFLAGCQAHIGDFEAIIVDDSPGKEHAELAHAEHITVLQGDGSLWWGGSVNKGLRYLFDEKGVDSGRVIALANNDSEIDAKTYSSMLEGLERIPNGFFHPRVFSLGSKKELEDCGNLISFGPVRCRYIIHQELDLAPCDLVSGRFLMSYARNFQKVGFMASNLPHYGGDWDFSLRAKRMGYPTFIVKQSICYVDEETSGNKELPKKSLKAMFRLALTDIKSPRNLRYKYQFIRNHNSWFKTVWFMVLETLKTGYILIVRL